MRFLALDFEMTGLDEENDYVLEVGAILLDHDLNELGRFTSVRDDMDYSFLCDKMGVKVHSMHVQSGLLSALSIESCVDSSVPWAEHVREKFSNLLGPHNPEEPVVLLGCTVHEDRKFLKRDWPSIEARLSHKHLDASSLLLCHKLSSIGPPGRAHRAIADAEEAVFLARTYREFLRDADGLARNLPYAS